MADVLPLWAAVAVISALVLVFVAVVGVGWWRRRGGENDQEDRD